MSEDACLPELAKQGSSNAYSSISPVEQTRLAVYKHFRTSTSSPSIAALASACGANEATIRGHLQELHDQRQLVLSKVNLDLIVMAHPFSSVPLGFAVMGRETLWWGGCAWDSFAMPHLLPEESPVLVSTRCPSCQKALALNISRDEPPREEFVAHFLVPTHSMWNDVVHTCSHQRLFCDERCVTAWLEVTGNTKGDILALSTLWKLASDWYTGRMEPGYRRREPAEARHYLRDAGLRGSFWGL